MPGRHKLVAAVVSMSLLWLTGSLAVSAGNSRDGLIEQRIVHEGIERSYFVHAPPSFDPTRRAACILVFHARGDSAHEISELTRFNRLADQEGFLVVYPEALKHEWSDGARSFFNDVGFVDTVVAAMQRSWNADPHRIYACGFSQGAFFCQYFALKEPGRLAAIACVGATMPEVVYHKRRPTQPLSVMFVLGKDDPIQPFDGGPFDPGLFGRGSLKSVSASDAVVFWVKGNKCDGSMENGVLPDIDQTDGTRVRWARYANCANGSEVVVFGVDGGGHTWPGGKQYKSERSAGRTSRDIDATREIWRFFRKHRLAAPRR